MFSANVRPAYAADGFFRTLWCDLISIVGVTCEVETESTVVNVVVEEKVDTQPVTPPEPTKIATTTTQIIKESSTYVTNEYVTNPTTIIRETVRESGGGSSSSGSNDFVSQTLFDAQVNATNNSIENSVGGLSDSLAESISTGLLTVANNTSLASLTASGAITLSSVSGGVLVTDANGVVSTTTIGAANITENSLDFNKLSNALTVDATTTFDLDTNSADLNFDNSTFFIDSSTNRVGVGTTTPLYSLDIDGIARASVYDKGGAVFNVKAYGAVGDGSTDDTVAIQTTIDAVNSAGGGVVIFPAGTFISQTLTLYSNVNIQGSGESSTVLKLKNNTNASLIKGYQFDSLTGTNGLGGISSWSIRDMTLDGNKANNSSGYGVQVYGYNFKLERVTVRSASQDGIYSEWSTDSNCPPDGNNLTAEQCMEAGLSHVNVHHSDGNGITWAGPHDSIMDAVITWYNANTGIDFREGGGGTQLSNSHSWGFSQDYAYKTAGTVFINNTQAEGASIAQFQINGWQTQITGGAVYNCNGGASGITIGNATTSPSRLSIDTTVRDNCNVNFVNDGGYSQINVLGYGGSSTAIASGTPATTSNLQFNAVNGQTGGLYSFNNNLGVGTTSPAARLHSYSGDNDLVFLGTSADTTATLSLMDNTTTNTFSVGMSAVGDALRLRSGGSEQLSMLSTGNVGIGTTNPGTKLQVIGTWGLTGADTITDNATKSFRIGGLSYDSDEEPVTALYVSGESAQNRLYIGGATSAGNAVTAMYFYTTPSINTQTGTERMRIDGNGNVMISTTTASRKFNVAGTVGFSGLTGSSGAGSLCLSASGEVVYNSGSDSCLPSVRELKNNINELSLSTSTESLLQELNPVSFIYNYDDTVRTRYGFIADEAFLTDKHLVTYDADGEISGLDTNGFLAIIVSAIKDIYAKIAGFAESFTTKSLNTEEFCIGDTCIDEARFKKLLEENGTEPIVVNPENNSSSDTITKTASTTEDVIETEEQTEDVDEIVEEGESETEGGVEEVSETEEVEEEVTETEVVVEYDTEETAVQE